MIFTDRVIAVRKGESKINDPIIVYRGDYELEVRFTIMNSKFKFMSGRNLIESENASYGQLIILTPYGGNIFSEIVKCNEGAVVFVLSKEMLDQIEELGLYSFQIRLFDFDKESRISIPPVEAGIEVREPITSEDHDNTINNAIVGYSIAKMVDPKEENIGPTFDGSGNYNETKWETGDRITEGKLNKIEEAIDAINKNEKNDVASLDKRVTNNFNLLDSTKADKNEIFTMTNMGQDIREAMTGGSVAVVGKNSVFTDNIVNEQITPAKTSFLKLNDINMLSIDDGRYEGNGLSLAVSNNIVTINGTSRAEFLLKLTNTPEIDLDITKESLWCEETATEFISGEMYSLDIYEISGEASSSLNTAIVLSVHDNSRTSMLDSTSNSTAVLPNDVAYIQLFIASGVTFIDYKITYGMVLGDSVPADYRNFNRYELDESIFIPASMKNSDKINQIKDAVAWRYSGSSKKYKEYPTVLTATQVMTLPGIGFNPIRGGCTDGSYLYCGVVSDSNDAGNTTIHKINIENWKIEKIVSVHSLGNCSSMTYCDFDGYIHCIGLESHNNHTVVHRITTDLEYVDNYIVDISPYYSNSTGVEAIDYNPNTEEFTFLIRGDSKGYIRYTKNKTYIETIWTECLDGATYAGISTDNNFIYQSVCGGDNVNHIGVIDTDGGILADIVITGMEGQIEETFIYKDKMIAVVNQGYTDNVVYEITMSNFNIVNQ